MYGTARHTHHAGFLLSFFCCVSLCCVLLCLFGGFVWFGWFFCGFLFVFLISIDFFFARIRFVDGNIIELFLELGLNERKAITKLVIADLLNKNGSNNDNKIDLLLKNKMTDAEREENESEELFLRSLVENLVGFN
jgi:hypothetical protein